MPTASGSTARPHHLRAFPGNPTITAPGCVPCREVPGAVRAAPAAAPHPARALQRLPHPYPHPSGGGRSPRPTLRRQLPVSRGELPPTSSAGARRCRAAGSPAATGAARGVRATEAAPRRGGAERSGAERNGPGAARGPDRSVRSAPRCGEAGCAGGREGGGGARPSFLIRGLRSAVSFSICNSAWLVGWVFFLLFSLKPFCSLFPRRSRRWSPVPPPGRCSACCCSASPPAQVSPELSRSALFFPYPLCSRPFCRSSPRSQPRTGRDAVPPRFAMTFPGDDLQRGARLHCSQRGAVHPSPSAATRRN